MCGILGIWAKNNAGKEKFVFFSDALRMLSHRGPDASAIKYYSNLSLGHTRLAIIDKGEQANQPFFSVDQNFALVFNGEIYNYRELRDELIGLGVNFTTESDTEVLLALLIYYRENALPKLSGIFAFAFYDVIQNELLIARDGMGIKPLYFYESTDLFAFSSETAPFEKLDLVQIIDKKALNYYFGLTYIPAPYSIYEQVRQVMPGTFLKFKDNVLQKTVYYESNTAVKPIEYNEAKSILYNSLEKSVKLQMVADVPLGCFLSGGLDSSIIAALAKIQYPALKTFSVGFDHPYFNETEYALEVAQKIGSNHTVFELTAQDFKENFHGFLGALDEPFADSSAFAVYLLCKKTKEHVTVVLSGDGADELFGGYRKHQAERKIRNLSRFKKFAIEKSAKVLVRMKSNRSDRFGELNRKLQKFARGIKSDYHERYWDWCQFIRPEDRQLLLPKHFESNVSVLNIKDWNSLQSILIADQMLVLPNDMLKKVDMMSMAHGLEVRTPFLDPDIVQFANRLPIEFKIAADNGKKILKDTFGHLLPTSILSRPKKGFEIPLKEWLHDEIATVFDDVIFSETYIAEQGLFSYEFIQNLKEKWAAPSFGERIYLVWALICYQHWWNKVNNKNNNVNSQSKFEESRILNQ